MPRKRPAPTPKPVSPIVPGADSVQALTERILQLAERSDKNAVTTRAEIGRLLAKVRADLPHGSWETWLELHVPFTLGTAKRAIRLHHVRRDRPQLFARIAPLGVAKAYLFLNLPDDVVDLLLSGPHQVPSTGAHKPVTAMTFAELMEVLAALGGEQDLDGAELLVRNYRRQVRGLIRAIDDLLEGHAAIEAADAEDELAELYDDLQQASDKLASAFSLEA